MRVGNGKAQAGDLGAARAAFEEALAVRRALAERNPDDAQWQSERDLSQKRLEGLKRQATGAAATRGRREDVVGPRRAQPGGDPERSQP